MKDVNGVSEQRVKPASVLGMTATAIMSLAIIYNAFFGQNARAPHPAVATAASPANASTRVDVVANPAPAGTIVLRYDPQIEEVQRRLLSTGDYKGMVDGVNGRQTHLAIEAYQRNAGLDVTGEVSADLLEHIRYTQEIAEAAQFTGSVAPPPAEENSKALADMRQLQTALAELGYSPGEITGHLNADTKQAILQFERDRKMPEDGALSPALMAEISKMSGDSSMVPQ
jgi:peptidoglycan hydrolase-like protein with peptidoglycan-binding domain